MSAAAPANPAQRRAGIIVGLVGFVIQVAVWLAAGLVLSIAVEIIGMMFWWPDQGAAHSQLMLQAELSYLSDQFPRSALSDDPLALATSLVGFAHEWLVVRSGLERLLGFLAAPAPPPTAQIAARTHDLLSPVVPYLQATITMVQVYAARLAVLLLSSLVFVLAALVGLIEGLIRRDLRRWGGGRESSFVYHHTRRLILPALLAPWVIYLSLPFTFHPAFVVLPAALATALTILTTSSRFKKYL